MNRKNKKFIPQGNELCGYCAFFRELESTEAEGFCHANPPRIIGGQRLGQYPRVLFDWPCCAKYSEPADDQDEQSSVNASKTP